MSVLGAANQLQIASFVVAGVEVPKELVASFETKVSCDSLIVEGQLIVEDVMDLGNLIAWTPDAQTDVSVRFTDLFGEVFEFTYRVMNIESIPGGIHNRTLIFQLRDIESWELSRCFLSKGFQTSSIEAFQAYLKHIGFEVPLNNQAAGADVGRDRFTVPANVSALEFFEDEFRRRGIICYRDAQGYHFYGASDLSLSSLPNVDEDVYTDETDNQLYKNRILDSNFSVFGRENSPIKTKSLFWDDSVNQITYSEDFSTEGLLMNDFVMDFSSPSSPSSRLKMSTMSNFGSRDLETLRDYLNQASLTIVVNGYVKNAVFRAFTIRLKGNKGVVESQTSGNTIVGSRWISTSVTTKVIGDAMVQKITLKRADGVKQS